MTRAEAEEGLVWHKESANVVAADVQRVWWVNMIMKGVNRFAKEMQASTEASLSRVMRNHSVTQVGTHRQNFWRHTDTDAHADTLILSQAETVIFGAILDPWKQ